MRWTDSQSILATILYASIFEYPLTLTEIHRWLIFPFPKPPSIRNYKQVRVIHNQENYYSDKHIYLNVLKRKRREKYSKKKWRIVKDEAKNISMIPGVMLLGISGGLAMNNADEEEDIDLFIICKKGTLWTTRLCVLMLLSKDGRRRRYGIIEERDLLCPNMFISDEFLRLPVKYRDVYTAHEILQMEPVFIRGNTYMSFLQENNWTQHVLPNAWKWRINIAQHHTYVHFSVFAWVGCFIFKLFNGTCKRIQLYIMRDRRTIETVTDTVMRFHPKDMRRKVNKTFKKLLKNYDIPLDSEFF